MAESRIVLRWIYGHKYLGVVNLSPVNGYYIEEPGNLKKWISFGIGWILRIQVFSAWKFFSVMSTV